jgi:hypothetical protein
LDIHEKYQIYVSTQQTDNILKKNTTASTNIIFDLARDEEAKKNAKESSQ